MKIFIMNGQGGSGKTTFEKFVKSYAWNSYFKEIAIASIIDPVKEIAKRIGWNGGKTAKDRAFLHDLKVLLQNYNNYDINYITNKIRCAAALDRMAIFIDMREKNDIEYFKQFYPEAKKVLVKRGEFTNYGNEADDNIMDITYDIIIENNGTLADLKSKAIEFYDKEISDGSEILH